MKMTCKIQFDPLKVSPKEIGEALEKLALAGSLDITWHNSREAAEKKAAKVGA